MSAPKSIELIQIINAMKSLRTNIFVPISYHSRMAKVKLLRSHDKTGIVNTVLDFMIHSATVPVKIETENKNLDKFLKQWQTSLLNKNISIDIPRGLREVTTEYHRERLYSSFIALNVKWDKVRLPDGSIYEVPTRMWIADGSSIYVEGKTNGLNTKQYFLGKKPDQKQLRNTTKNSVLIRKPFNSLYEKYPTPYTVKRGILFNALLKEAIITKQADVIEAIIPYLLLLKSGTDKLAEYEMLADEVEMKKLKETIVKATNEHDTTGELGKLIASLSYDVNVEHLIPDLTKIFDSSITAATNKNLLAGLGLIELQGFSSNRQETILNPKVLIEEVKDAVLDWTCLLEEVMYEMIDRNKRTHPKLANNKIRVVPGKITAFITDDFRVMMRSLYDRGLFSKQSAIEDIGESDFEVELERLNREAEMNLQERMKPPVIQNIEKDVDPDLQEEDVLPDRKPGTPEVDNFNNAVLKNYKFFKKSTKIKTTAPFDNIDDLPKSIKNALPFPAQIIFLSAFNSAIEQGNTEESILKNAWSSVEKKYKKNKDNKWVKK